jgi:hypothetical protein
MIWLRGKFAAREIIPSQLKLPAYQMGMSRLTGTISMGIVLYNVNNG